jgi:xeroderma pigmentosum group C-complementing protein
MPRSAPSRRGRSRREVTGKRKDEDNEEEIPQVYRELLAEADARSAKEPLHDSPVKRRKVGDRGFATETVESGTEGQAVSESNTVIDLTQGAPIYDLDAEDGSEDDSDMEWEEVLIQQPETRFQDNVTGTGDEALDITLEEPFTQRRTIMRRRKPVSGTEKKLRLDIHKNHVLCLLGHVYIRNLWCNDDEVQKFLKQMLTKQTIALLNPKESMHQFSRSTTFIDGLRQASEIFSRRFRITAYGLRKPYWAENEQECKDRAASIMREGETVMSKEDFRGQVKKLQGSRDFGAQLFCSLLRSAAVEARLVCSLQALPFSGVAKGASPEKPKREYIVISSDDNMSSSDDKSVAHLNSSPAKGRRIGQPYFKTPAQSSSSSHFGTWSPVEKKKKRTVHVN